MRLLATRAMRHYYRQLRVCDCFSFTNYQNRLNKGGSGTRLRLSQQILENVECGRLRLRKKFCKCWIFSFLGQKTNFSDRWSIWIRIFTDGFSSELRPRAVQLSVCRSEGASTQHISKYCKLLPTYLHVTGVLLQVTEDNKQDYVRLVCQMKMTGAIRDDLPTYPLPLSILLS